MLSAFLSDLQPLYNQPVVQKIAAVCDVKRVRYEFYKL
jgi:hypothetical protein